MERIIRSTVPQGMYAYDMQTSESDWSLPCLLAPHITVEHFGTVLTGAPIDLAATGYRDLSPADFEWPSPNDRPTVAEFAARYGLDLSPPLKANVEQHARQAAR